jgi:hypothetical protein
MNAAARGPASLTGAVIALALGVVVGVAAVFTAASVLGQEPANAATPQVEVLDYGTR